MTSGIWKKVAVCRVHNVAQRGKRMLLTEEEGGHVQNEGQRLWVLWVQGPAFSGVYKGTGTPSNS